jgi:hypothetical protein
MCLTGEVLPTLAQGVWLRDYEPMSGRQQHAPNPAQTLGLLAPSNAYRRRIAGSNWA